MKTNSNGKLTRLAVSVNQREPFSRPELKELIGKRIDVLCSFDIDIKNSTTELRFVKARF